MYLEKITEAIPVQGVTMAKDMSAMDKEAHARMVAIMSTVERKGDSLDSWKEYSARVLDIANQFGVLHLCNLRVEPPVSNVVVAKFRPGEQGAPVTVRDGWEWFLRRMGLNRVTGFEQRMMSDMALTSRETVWRLLYENRTLDAAKHMANVALLYITELALFRASELYSVFHVKQGSPSLMSTMVCVVRSFVGDDMAEAIERRVQPEDVWGLIKKGSVVCKGSFFTVIKLARRIIITTDVLANVFGTMSDCVDALVEFESHMCKIMARTDDAVNDLYFKAITGTDLTM
jgi:hypothetical protein